MATNRPEKLFSVHFHQPALKAASDFLNTVLHKERHCCKVSDEAAFCLIQRPYISKTLLTRRISPRGSP
ncbi:TPA_asm: hypothetical protein G0P61_17665 [Salmonella enterica subsp. enterica serovar Typhimurium]|nr:hypothetical protein [Salmonella enterica subsp. enterica serovar Typhimurium]